MDLVLDLSYHNTTISKSSNACGSLTIYVTSFSCFHKLRESTFRNVTSLLPLKVNNFFNVARNWECLHKCLLLLCYLLKETFAPSAIFHGNLHSQFRGRVI